MLKTHNIPIWKMSLAPESLEGNYLKFTTFAVCILKQLTDKMDTWNTSLPHTKTVKVNIS